MAKTWVLDTATKGTGASVVPLERGREQPPAKRTAGTVDVPRKPAPRRKPAPAPRQPRAFRVVDVVTREVLAEGVDMRATLALLRDRVRSIVDVHVSVHDGKHDRWRLLTLAEQRALWDARDQGAAASTS